jgi:hypothetical protein
MTMTPIAVDSVGCLLAVALDVTDVERWTKAVKAAVATAHRAHHDADEYPASADRCWAEPCRSLLELTAEIETVLFTAEMEATDDEEEQVSA